MGGSHWRCRTCGTYAKKTISECTKCGEKYQNWWQHSGQQAHRALQPSQSDSYPKHGKGSWWQQSYQGGAATTSGQQAATTTPEKKKEDANQTLHYQMDENDTLPGEEDKEQNKAAMDFWQSVWKNACASKSTDAADIKRTDASVPSRCFRYSDSNYYEDVLFWSSTSIRLL